MTLGKFRVTLQRGKTNAPQPGASAPQVGVRLLINPYTLTTGGNAFTTVASKGRTLTPSQMSRVVS